MLTQGVATHATLLAEQAGVFKAACCPQRKAANLPHGLSTGSMRPRRARTDRPRAIRRGCTRGRACDDDVAVNCVDSLVSARCLEVTDLGVCGVDGRQALLRGVARLEARKLASYVFLARAWDPRIHVGGRVARQVADCKHA